MRETAEAIVGAVTGSLTAPRGLLVGRYDHDGRLQYTGRTTTLTRTASTAVAGQLASAQHGHPWTGWSFSAGWGSRETLNVTLVEPDLVVEVGVDVARDAAGRWRHPARWHRARRPDLSPRRRPPPDVTAALTAAGRGGPADAQPAERAPIPGCVRAAHPAHPHPQLQPGHGRRGSQRGCQRPDHAVGPW
ncbi:hypothetical protein QFZ22_000024 [Streptomyces canus]|uniref:DNA ligase (ATP) n=1 Tax=Streptomyces canus TaxID=58343 RepID=A0AAW8F1U0_9ACTN|nr:hypothetical protein [Streptomyces canus]MDQ0904039.1 hypothetical protein [Streptomyces canus]